MNRIACKESKAKFVFSFIYSIYNSFLLYVKGNNGS